MVGSKVIWLLVVGVSVCHCLPPYHHLMHEEEAQDEPPMYMFEYKVEDRKTGDIKSHSEERNGDSTRGEYRLVEPDGSTRIVKYTVEGKDGGFNAEVTKEGGESNQEAAANYNKYSHQQELKKSAQYGSHHHYISEFGKKLEDYQKQAQAAPQYEMAEAQESLESKPEEMPYQHTYFQKHAYIHKQALPLYTVPVYLKAIKTIKVPIAKFPLIQERTQMSDNIKNYGHNVLSSNTKEYESSDSDAAISSASISLHGAQYETNIRHVLPISH